MRISESFVGRVIACTSQRAGATTGAAFPKTAGCGIGPSAATKAEVIVVYGSSRFLRSAHACWAAAEPSGVATSNATAVHRMTERFIELLILPRADVMPSPALPAGTSDTSV